MKSKLGAVGFVVMGMLVSVPLSSSFPNTKRPKDDAKQLLGIRASDDIADGVHRGAEVFGDELRRKTVGKRLLRSEHEFTGAFKARLMPRIDRHGPVAARCAARDCKKNGITECVETCVIQT